MGTEVVGEGVSIADPEMGWELDIVGVGSQSACKGFLPPPP